MPYTSIFTFQIILPWNLNSCMYVVWEIFYKKSFLEQPCRDIFTSSKNIIFFHTNTGKEWYIHPCLYARYCFQSFSLCLILGTGGAGSNKSNMKVVTEPDRCLCKREGRYGGKHADNVVLHVMPLIPTTWNSFLNCTRMQHWASFVWFSVNKQSMHNEVSS